MIISGNIKDNTGEPLMGANIYATLSSGARLVEYQILMEILI